ncbi:amidophosphoribosyltransferase [Chitinophaga nivalis]|uniref:Amidophosphoribosyltransferase n=1 Tax=Chitinophaga nivalis TaxID=2991709 RepID=A0ABT3IUZ2_9BACT|nr:amidophosphoribosyltransferase [Chitinophaga nivalis]MCW3462497.1 amidophosphoribosyltransferase [Chitinophaga nivalis]MCW3487812.1 amidophosphoribosyltransferase [Chitinophaga nivalis]
MEKQHNRGQDGAGIATVKLDTEPGVPFMHRLRSSAPQAIGELFGKIREEIQEIEKYQPEITKYPGLMKGHNRFLGELLMGHLRYATQGKNNVELCHPFVRYNTIPARNLAMAGNFNLVNADELFKFSKAEPGEVHKNSDLAAMLETVHHFLTKEDEERRNGLDVKRILQQSFSMFDGGYHACGLIGTGDAFVIRDAHGIRPSYYYVNDDVIVAASERAAIRTTFNVGENEVLELMPGHALIVKNNGEYKIEQILEPKERKACSFERIYFSRGNDEKIYKERTSLGRNLSGTVLKAIDNDLRNTIFSFIPNTAEVAFYGLLKGLEDYLNKIKVERILSWGENFDEEKLNEMVNRRIRIDKIAIKDVKMRTFITEDSSRNEMVQHVYDITYGTVRPGIDSLVVIDDSIVRGTTLKESIIKMLDRLGPKKIIVVSSAPQIRYPDCYGIDMSKMGDFVAFQAAIALLKDHGKEHILQEAYGLCKELDRTNTLHAQNVVKHVYKPFTPAQISAKIAEILTPAGIGAEVEVIYQSIESLHEACPNNLGDWYFTGDYPTPGGNRVVNKAFMNFMEGKNERGY